MSARRRAGARPRRSGLIRRPPRAVPVVLLAAALLIVGGLGTWVLVTYLVDDTWPAAASATVETISGTGLGSTETRIAAVVLAVAGCALMLSAIVPGRPSRVLVLGDDVPGETAISRRDVARRIQRRTENVDGVRGASVAVGRRRVDVAVETVVDDTAPVTRGATAAVEEALAELRPLGPTRHRVRTHRRS
ncbi:MULTISPECIES: DUF6286 domain-containing protein [unclassified Dietzia]|uniref:DUF6286 domain-containing protein n=1 Tax=unclassified Dietzia TaxID=2617939 RepID=UPI000D200E71|nr:MULTISPECIES: DUF6286 domain-containing protein [unclassified Dietzia]AVZ40242.1 alkaline shock response membrane anchor protein AmaP [Dietzia sp. JS16-p6b]QGW25706.1 hypothetical protein GJR88_04120 [Dietzia sp. DQ12-45-1b]